MKLIHDLEPGARPWFDDCPADGLPVAGFVIERDDVSAEMHPLFTPILVSERVTLSPCGHAFSPGQLRDWAVHEARDSPPPA